MPRNKRVAASDSLPVLVFEERNETQKYGVEIFHQHDMNFFLGPAGTGKTIFALAMALREMFEHNTSRRKRVQKIIVARPVVEVGVKMGALPGDIDEKMNPHMIPIYDNLKKLLFSSEKSVIDKFITDNVEIAPLAYMRGRTFEHNIVILDEAQNCTKGELKMFLTRLGIGGKMIVAGDTDQADIPNSGLLPWANALRNKHGIGFVDFTEDDIVRHPLLRTILANAPK